jgi:hypothetical protein
VIESRRRPGFAKEPLSGGRIVGGRRREDFQRDATTQPGVIRKVHLTHAAGTE